ncbi:MAG: hypothetical protein PHV77_00505 [Candidatus Omnitrophica bacterium]|jgi:hypothetical protein|nr:hypothetical protein [Candidatus Omnitrophota bacterium]
MRIEVSAGVLFSYALPNRYKKLLTFSAPPYVGCYQIGRPRMLSNKITSMKNSQFKEIFIESNLKEYVLGHNDHVYVSQWYSGTTSKNWKPYFKRDSKKTRFAPKEQAVCYLAKDCARIDFEIGEYFKNYKVDNNKPDFNQDLWPRMTSQIASPEPIQEIKGAFKINQSAKIFNFDKDIQNQSALDILFQRNEQSYKKSGEFAEYLLNMGFDGILYKPCTSINGILGPCNDSMLVLFEPKDKNRKLFSYYHINKEI